MLTGKQIKRLRQALDLTQEEFAVKFGITGKAVSFWETERVVPPTKTMARLEELFGEHIQGNKVQEEGGVYAGYPPDSFSLAKMIYERLPRDRQRIIEEEFIRATWEQKLIQEKEEEK